NSPFRERSIAENLDLFRRMRAGEFPNGARVLRAKIDMASGNINLRDPVLYRILHATHPRTGDKWSIYPSYDYAHGQSDAIEGITHSICTLEFCIREELNRTALRRMAVLRPLKVVIENYPEGQLEELEAVNHPDNPAAGMRRIAFGRELFIERDDFMENPPKKFFRLSPGNEVRLRYAYFVKCTGVIKNDAGEVVELRCTYDPATKGGNAPDGRKVKATMHWLSAAQSVPAEIRVYNQL